MAGASYTEEMLQTYLFLCLSAFLAGVVNSIAGGGTLLTFPALMAVVTPVEANGTSTFALVPGTAAGFCTTVAYVPQLVKIWKQGGKDLSYGMLGLYLFGVLLWLVYGLVTHAQAVFLTNLATAILIAVATGLKAWTAKRDFGKTVMGDVRVEAGD